MKWLFLPAFVLLFVPGTSFAVATLSLDSNTLDTVNDPIGISVDCDLNDDNKIYLFDPNGVTVSDVNCNLGVPYYFNNWTLDNVTYWFNSPNQTGTYEFYYIPSNLEYPACITFDGVSNDLDACLTEFPTMFLLNSFSFGVVIENINQVWGAGGLFGTSTNMASIVASGVTATGANIWTLFIFLGVLVAIYIAIKVQDFIMLSFAPIEAPKTKKRRGVDRTGDYKAFKRGKKELPGLWKD